MEMFKRKPLGASKATDAAAKLKAEKKAMRLNSQYSQKKKAAMVLVALLSVIVVLFGLFIKTFSDKRHLQLQNKAIKAKITELAKPQYNTVQDFLLTQCGDDGVFCVSTQTDNPSMEMLKFLVNFREKPGFQYRLIFELSAGGNKEVGEVLACNGEDANFYVCQEISSATPTDVIRAFEQSYRSLQGEASYDFNLMVKPVGPLEYVKPIAMKPAG